MKVKICGITNLEDALFCARQGADALGFIFYEKSKRVISKSHAREIIGKLPPFIKTVGVFVNSHRDEILKTKSETGIDLIQLHGDEDPEFVKSLGVKSMKAVRIKDEISVRNIEKFPNIPILLDSCPENSYGGSGETFDWESLSKISKYDNLFVLSGGLTPENVATGIGLLNPYGVDVCSGVEKEYGKKDFEKVIKFMKALEGM